MGAQAIQARLETFDLKAEFDKLNELSQTGKGQKKTRAIKRLKVVNSFLNTRNKPASMVLDCVPVIPPDLRPMVQLCLLYTSPSPRDRQKSRMPSSA